MFEFLHSEFGENYGLSFRQLDGDTCTADAVSAIGFIVGHYFFLADFDHLLDSVCKCIFAATKDDSTLVKTF